MNAPLLGYNLVRLVYLDIPQHFQQIAPLAAKHKQLAAETDPRIAAFRRPEGKAIRFLQAPEHSLSRHFAPGAMQRGGFAGSEVDSSSEQRTGGIEVHLVAGSRQGDRERNNAG
jgi:hypothetical protein